MPEPKPLSDSEGLSAWERRGLLLFVILLIGFGFLVEQRSAFLKRRMGDWSVFARTAWAVRTGENIYSVTDENHFHYHYPPLFAILLWPLADPPAGADHAGYLPYPVSVGVWYILSLLFLALAVHTLASALEATSSRTTLRYSRRWWLLRMVPILVCLPPIGHTLMRGQVGLLLLLLLCGLIAAVLRRRRVEAGLWLAGAICLKVIPVFLLLFPLVRRDARCLATCCVGLVIGLATVPLAVFGPQRTTALYQEWANDLIRPGLGAGGNGDERAKELLNVTATDSQSFQAIFHNTLYPDPYTRPRQASEAVRRVHWLAGGVLTLLTLLVWPRRDDAAGQVLCLGSLILIMLLLSPVCHLHYFCMMVPLVMGLLAVCWEASATVGIGWRLLFTGFVIANVVPQFGAFQLLRDDGLVTYAALLLWAAAILVLNERKHRTVPLAPAARLAA
jgi:hypothetical protein